MQAIIFAFGPSICLVAANPVQLELLEARNNSDSNQHLSSKAWMPIVVVSLILCLIALMIWCRDSLQKVVVAMAGAYGTAHAGAPTGSNSRGAGRVLTAQELVGSINGTDLPTSQNARRTRRPRRTPSQASVTSLPVYNKDPGEEELVIFRGRDMEDAIMPAATMALPAADEDDSLNSHDHSDHSQVSRYSPMPVTSNNMPLLHNDDPSGDLSLQSLQSPDARLSFDSSLHNTSSLLGVDAQASSDLRGEAPPYFEVVDHTPELDSGVPTTQTSSSISHEPPRRTSGFRTFLNRMSMMSPPSEHRRTESNQSVSAQNAHRREPSIPSRISTHRASSSVSLFRTLSRQKSIQTLNSSVRLNSPSLISLNSISAPLSHTLIRTEFTYPKSGPTPQQLKVISSRENFSRFGVPYGRDAIAFAASSSRQDLEPPPPDFEASSSQLPLVTPGNLSDTQTSRPSISEPKLGGEGEQDGTIPPQSVDARSENITNTSTPSITHTSPSTSPSIDPTDPPSSSSTSTSTLPPLLP